MFLSNYKCLTSILDKLSLHHVNNYGTQLSRRLVIGWLPIRLSHYRIPTNRDHLLGQYLDFVTTVWLCN